MKNNLLKYFFISIFSFCLVLLDTSFFSMLTFYEAQIIISFLALIIFALKVDEILTFFCFSIVIFFAVFSSLPVWLILINFLLIPSVVLYLRKNFLPEPSMVSLPLYFMITCFAFEFVLLLYSHDINSKSLLVLVCFALINCFFGTILLLLSKVMELLFKRGEIKL